MPIFSTTLWLTQLDANSRCIDVLVFASNARKLFTVPADAEPFTIALHCDSSRGLLYASTTTSIAHFGYS